MPQRRSVLQAGLAGALSATGLAVRADEAEIARRLRTGGVVLALRHAQAPGTFDPPGFRLGDCSTQRNLDDAGRDQARRIGAWFRERRLSPAAVRSSPWCRCMDTATLAFGSAEAWAPLGSVRRTADEQEQVQTLRKALAGVAAGRFEVWVTHQFTLNALVGSGSASGEGLLLRAAGETVELLDRLAPP